MAEPITEGKRGRGAPLGSQNRLVHGGEAGIKRLQHGQQFLEGTPAHQAEVAVYDDIERHGLRSYLESRAVQVEAVCDLFYAEIARAAEAQDAELLDKRVKRWGWLRGVADRTWKLVLQLQAVGEDSLIVDAIAAAKGASEDG